MVLGLRIRSDVNIILGHANNVLNISMHLHEFKDILFLFGKERQHFLHTPILMNFNVHYLTKL
jgi:hypothetical protein